MHEGRGQLDDTLRMRALFVEFEEQPAAAWQTLTLRLRLVESSVRSAIEEDGSRRRGGLQRCPRWIDDQKARADEVRPRHARALDGRTLTRAPDGSP
jgi:hypothetical protein